MDILGRIDPDVDGPDATDSGRTRKRDSLFLTAKLTLPGRDAVDNVRVRNLSEGGLMAEYDRAVEPGTPVTLELRGLGELDGRVAWCTRGRLGIAFEQPIDPARARKPVGTGASSPSYAKPLVITTRRR